MAQLASDQAWLWSRGYEGGGPQLELLRRLAHWLMKEPELEEEETLSVAVNGGEITLTRRSLGEAPDGIEATLPDGSVQVLQLSEVGPGHWQAILPAQANGLYRFSDGELEAIAAVGPAVPKEFENPISTAELLAPLTGLTRGGSFSVETGGVPDLRMVREGRASAGRNWMGLAERNAYSVTDLRQIPLAPAWLMLMLAGLLSLLAWRVGAR